MPPQTRKRSLTSEEGEGITAPRDRHEERKQRFRKITDITKDWGATQDTAEAEPESMPDWVAKLTTVTWAENKPTIKKLVDQWNLSSTAISLIASEYVCSITQELMWDPVLAQDGHCYERAAIESWFLTKPDMMVKSPLTRETMGKTLVPAKQVRNVITHLINSGQVDPDLVAAYKKAAANHAQVQALIARAEKGDASAMGRLGFAYRDGTRGLVKDAKKAFEYFKQAADGGDPPASTSCGVAYINGSGVAKSHTRGIVYITKAATLGSEHAHAILAWANELGHHGFDKNIEEATRLYKLMQNCTIRDSVKDYRTRCEAWLAEHP